MGLPLCHVQRSLAKLDIFLVEDVPAICQQNLHYTCPIWQEVRANRQ